MPKIEITDAKGLVQKTGSGVSLNVNHIAINTNYTPKRGID